MKLVDMRLSAAAIRELRLAAQGPRPLLSPEQFQKFVGVELEPRAPTLRETLTAEERAEALELLEAWKKDYGVPPEASHG